MTVRNFTASDPMGHMKYDKKHGLVGAAHFYCPNCGGDCSTLNGVVDQETRHAEALVINSVRCASCASTYDVSLSLSKTPSLRRALAVEVSPVHR